MILEDYLNSIGLLPRLQQHDQAVRQDFQQGGFGLPKGVFDALVGTVLGLPIEGAAALGKAATGQLNASIGQVTQGTPLQTQFFNQAYQGYGGGTPLQDTLLRSQPLLGFGVNALRAALAGGGTPELPPLIPSARDINQGRAANEASAGVNKYATGIENMLLDPSNAVFGAVGKVTQAKKATKLAAIANAGGDVSPGFMDNLAEKLIQGKKSELADLGQEAETLISALRKPTPITTPLETPPVAAPLSKQEARVAKLQAQLPQAQAEAATAKEAWQTQVKGYRDFKAGKGDLSTLLEALPSLPKEGETFKQFTGAHYSIYQQTARREKYIANELSRILTTPATPAVETLPQTGAMLSGTPAQLINGQPVRVPGPAVPEINSLFPEGHIAPETKLTPEQITKLGGTPTPTAPAGSDEAVRQTAATLNNPVALDGSTPTTEPGYGGALVDLVKYALQEGKKAQLAAMQKAGKGGLSLGEFTSVWKGAITQTVRNLLMDEAFTRMVASNEGIRQRTINTNEKWIASRLHAGEDNPALLLGKISDYLVATGSLGEQAPTRKIQEAFVKNMGANIFDLEVKGATDLTALEFLKYQTLAQLANPLRGSVSLLTAPLGYLAPMRMKMFHILNTVTHTASRTAAFEQAFLPYLDNSAQRLFAAARAEGKDISSLVGRGVTDGAEVLSREGLFSAEEVRQALGNLYAEEWQRMVDEAVQAGFARSKQVFGDYANRSMLEQRLNTFMPFMSWTWRAMPRVSRMVLEHPAVGNALLHYYEVTQAIAQREKQPDYYSGNIGINQDTPFLGLLAKLFSPEEQATLRANPIGLFLSINPDAALGALTGDTVESKTPYQMAKVGAGLVGGQFNPLIQGLAYVTGQDYQSPGALSRYAPVDQAVGTLTGGALSAPSIAQGPLRAARKQLTGKTDNYDPVEAVAQRLVMERSGVPVADKRNKRYAIEIANKTGIYQEAQRLLDLGNTGGNPLAGGLGGYKRTLFNAMSPVSASVDPLLSQQARQAKAGMPFSYEEIQQAQQSNPTEAGKMKDANLKYQLSHPAAAVSMNPQLSSRDTQDPRLTAWENTQEHLILKKYLPQQYAALRKEFMANAGIR